MFFYRVIFSVVATALVAHSGLGQSIRVSNGQPITVQGRLKQLRLGLSESALVAALRDTDPEVRGLAAVQLAAYKDVGATSQLWAWEYHERLSKFN